MGDIGSDAFIEEVSSAPTETGVTLCELAEITPTAHDHAPEARKSELRRLLLTRPEVIAHLRELGLLRGNAAGTAGHVGTIEHGAIHVQQDIAAGRDYWTAIDSTPLLEQFTPGELDYYAGSVDTRLEMGLWPIRAVCPHGPGYGRTKARRGRNNAQTAESAAEYVEDMVRRLTGGRDAQPRLPEDEAVWESCAACSALPGEACAGEAMHVARLTPQGLARRAQKAEADRIRQIRSRMRKLPHL